jgi:hypothetical protein
MVISYVVWVKPYGIISHIQSWNAESPEEGSITNDNETIYYLQESVLEDIGFKNPAQFLDSYYRKEDSWLYRGRPTDYQRWVKETEVWEVDTDLVISETRNLRNFKLGVSDWTQAVDAPLSEEKKVEWRTYRQALRDIMANLPADLDDPKNVSWPTEPS